MTQRSVLGWDGQRLGLSGNGLTMFARATISPQFSINPADAVATLAQPLWGIKRVRASFTRPRAQIHPPGN